MRSGLRKFTKLSAQNLMTFLIGILIGAIISGWRASAATISPDVAISGVQFANEQEIETRLDLNFHVADSEQLNELRLLGFFESGHHGQTSIDLDPVVLRFTTLKDSHLWVGRAHPAGEAFRLKAIDRASALGANWTQNQHDALEPRVSGWIGAGFRQAIPSTRLSVTASFSPIFLPSFGPSLELSPDDDATGSRFTKLPPARVRISEKVLLPIRYDLQTGDLREIVRQDQVFVSTGYEHPWVQTSLFGWSAPKPDPVIAHFEKLRIVRESDADVIVTAKPSFPRQTFWGMRVASRDLLLSPEVELAWETQSRQTTVSAALQPLERWRLGALNRFGERDPTYARTLIWTEASSGIYKSLSGGLRYEQHLLHDYEGGWVKPTLLYQANRNFEVFATADVIAGQDGSYFGNWRALDSFAMGARAQW
jgi:hypothetical protein